MKNLKKIILSSITLIGLCVISCRDEMEVNAPEIVSVASPEGSSAGTMLGFYLLNEGNMGSNKATLDFFDFIENNYHRNIFAHANPTVPKELGDVGNDLAIYGSKLYAVINVSNKIEVMDKRTVRRLGQINIPNCRYIKFHDGYAYVTSYAGPVRLDPHYEQRGYVAKVDTATFEVVATCLVGFQPDDLEIVGEKIYVANSGGYNINAYESTVSVIDIATFTEINRIEVAENLHRMLMDNHGVLWVSSRGNYYETPSMLHWIDLSNDVLGGTIEAPISGMTIVGDSLYFYGADFNYITFEWKINFGIIDVVKKEIITRNFLADGAEKKFVMPRGIMVNPTNKDIYLTDAANFVHPGMLFCFDRHGKEKWSVQTGDIPAHFAVLYE